MLKKNIYSIVSLCSLYSSSPLEASWSNLWQKKSQEQITKDYSISDSCHITLDALEGSILVKPWNEKKVALEITKKGTEEEMKATTVSSKGGEKEVTITTRVLPDQQAAHVDFVLMVPHNISLSLTQARGPVTLKGISGALNISLEEGAISIEDSKKSVVAKTGYGAITIKQTTFDETSSIFLETLRGTITLSLPRQTRATLHAKTSAGKIISDHPLTLAPVTLTLNHQSWERLKKDVEGSLGGLKGGAPITLEVTKGDIFIKES